MQPNNIHWPLRWPFREYQWSVRHQESSCAPENPDNLGRMASLGRTRKVTPHEDRSAGAARRPAMLQTPAILGDVLFREAQPNG